MRYNDTAVHSVPLGINIIGSILNMNALKSQNKTPYPLETTILPFPGLKPEWTYDATAFTSILLIGLSLIVIPGGFGILVVAERQVRIKWQQRRLHSAEKNDQSKFVFLGAKMPWNIWRFGIAVQHGNLSGFMSIPLTNYDQLQRRVLTQNTSFKEAQSRCLRLFCHKIMLKFENKLKIIVY